MDAFSRSSSVPIGARTTVAAAAVVALVAACDGSLSRGDDGGGEDGAMVKDGASTPDRGAVAPDRGTVTPDRGTLGPDGAGDGNPGRDASPGLDVLAREGGAVEAGPGDGAADGRSADAMDGAGQGGDASAPRDGPLLRDALFVDTGVADASGDGPISPATDGSSDALPVDLGPMAACLQINLCAHTCSPAQMNSCLATCRAQGCAAAQALWDPYESCLRTSCPVCLRQGLNSNPCLVCDRANCATQRGQCNAHTQC